MLCQNCKKNEATTHIKRVFAGETTQNHLCRECAANLGFDDIFDDFSFSVPSIFSSLFDDAIFSLGDSRMARCEKCGSSFDDIIKSGKVGCADCYRKFNKELLPSIQRIHGKVKHSGGIPEIALDPITPKELTAEEKLQQLEDELNKAVAEQNFEQAAIIRDKIKELKGEN